MTIDEAKQSITDSNLSPQIKERLFLILPNLGQTTLSGLVKETCAKESLIIAEYLISRWEGFANILTRLKNQNSDAFQDFLNLLEVNRLKLNGEDEVFFLTLVIDIRRLAYNERVKLSSSQYEQLLDYELRLFWRLPKEEVLLLIKSHILYFCQKLNFFFEIQLIVYENDWDLSKDFSKVFAEAILQNKEMLGKKNAGQWIKDFINYSLINKSKVSNFQAADFIIRDQDVQKLSKEEKGILSEILKLYIWFFEPVIDVKEVLAYKDHKITGIENEIDEYFEKQLNTITEPEQRLFSDINIKNISAPIEVRLPQNGSGKVDQNELTKKSQINIDQKLQDLKKKVSQN